MPLSYIQRPGTIWLFWVEHLPPLSSAGRALPRGWDERAAGRRHLASPRGCRTALGLLSPHLWLSPTCPREQNGPWAWGGSLSSPGPPGAAAREQIVAGHSSQRNRTVIISLDSPGHCTDTVLAGTSGLSFSISKKHYGSAGIHLESHQGQSGGNFSSGRAATTQHLLLGGFALDPEVPLK